MSWLRTRGSKSEDPYLRGLHIPWHFPFLRVRSCRYARWATDDGDLACRNLLMTWTNGFRRLRGRMSFHETRLIRAAAGRLLEHNQQRDHDKRRDHQQLEIVDVGNDLRLPRDHGVECGAS